MALTINGTDGIETNTDTGKIKVGAGDDLSIYHTGSQSRIENTTGELRIQSDTIQITDKEGNDMHIECNHDGNVELYYDNAKKFETVTGGATITGTCTATSFAGDGSALTGITSSDTLSFRNIVINGAMNIAQRATSSTSTAYQTCDRIRVDTANVDEAATQAQVSLSSSDTGPWAKGFRKALQVTNGNQTSGAGSNDLVNAAMYLEGQDVHLIWEPNNTNSKITLSWWMKSSVAQTFYGYIRTLNGTSKSIAFTTGSLSANTWTKITKTIPGHADLTIPNDNTAGIGIFWDYFRGTDKTDSGVSTTAWQTYDSSARTPDCTSTWYTTNDATIAMTGIQLEAGDTATEFEHRSYGEELIRCQRYYEILCEGVTQGLATCTCWGTSETYSPIVYQVEKRTTPSFEVSATDDFGIMSNTAFNTATAIGQTDTNVRGTRLYLGVSSAPFVNGHSGWIKTTSDCKFAANSEL